MGPTLTTGPRADWLVLWNLVERMAPRQRLFWLQHCARLASTGQNPVKVAAFKGSAEEAYWDFRSLVGQGALSYDRAGELAERIIRGK